MVVTTFSESTLVDVGTSAVNHFVAINTAAYMCTRNVGTDGMVTTEAWHEETFVIVST